jgi:predicted PurR-regulated permease PerM
MLLVYLLVGTLNSIGLLALGIKHAVLFGMLTAIMTIIPYFGIINNSLIPISVIWLSKDSVWYTINVIAVFSVVQYLEANVIFPKVVGSQLNISTWAALIAAIAGGILWGAAGMVLFIPLIAILKIISDEMEGWKPLNVLLRRQGTDS